MTTIQQLPQFIVYPKRKSTLALEAEMYMRISYEFSSIEKSLGIKIIFSDWDAHGHTVKHNPIHDFHIKQKSEEYKQRLMGSYYMLTQLGGEFKIAKNYI